MIHLTVAAYWKSSDVTLSVNNFLKFPLNRAVTGHISGPEQNDPWSNPYPDCDPLIDGCLTVTFNIFNLDDQPDVFDKFDCWAASK